VTYSMPMPLLGIMVTELTGSHTGELPFAHSDTFQGLCVFGLRAGIEIFVFSPIRVDWTEERITGYTYQEDSKGWERKSFPLPDLIYDRCFFASKSAYLYYRDFMQKVKGRAAVQFLGNGLPGKWGVAQMLAQHSSLLPYLPETCPISHVQQVLNWLELKGDVFLKPQSGSQGKGVLSIKYTPQDKRVFFVSGRDGWNRPFRFSCKESAQLKRWLGRFFGGRPYLIQQYLHLQTAAGIAYDVRSMVQKNGHGRWQLTGMGIRCGQPGSITANLHGGGSASEVFPFLAAEFSSHAAAELIATLSDLSAKIPPALEAAHGRLSELGIDFGIDSSGRVWILEVNSKPGRTIFNHLSNETARKNCKENLIRYAAYLLRTQKINPNRTGAFSTQTGMESKYKATSLGG
jgi:glutathione synthase/RimK-type ligase-like ATP-grasp enzyme